MAAFLSSSCTFSFITTLFFNNTYKIYPLKYTLKCLLIVDNTTLQNPVPFCQCSSSLSGSLNRLLSSAKWMSAALPHSRYCTNQWMFHYQSAHLDWNLYCGCDTWQMHQDRKIERWVGEYKYTHFWVTRLRVRKRELRHCDQVAQVGFRAKVPSVLLSAVSFGLVEVHPCLCTSSMSADSVVCHFGKEGSRLFHFSEA